MVHIRKSRFRSIFKQVSKNELYPQIRHWQQLRIGTAEGGPCGIYLRQLVSSWGGNCCMAFSKCLVRAQHYRSKVALYHTPPTCWYLLKLILFPVGFLTDIINGSTQEIDCCHPPWALVIVYYRRPCLLLRCYVSVFSVRRTCIVAIACPSCPAISYWIHAEVSNEITSDS